MRFFLPSNLAIGQYKLANTFQNYFPSKTHGLCGRVDKGKVALIPYNVFQLPVIRCTVFFTIHIKTKIVQGVKSKSLCAGKN